MGLWENNPNLVRGAKTFLGGIKNTIKNTNISSVLMTAASMYWGSKEKIEWYFSPATNYASLYGTKSASTSLGAFREIDATSSALNNPLTNGSVLPSAYFIDMTITQNGQAVGAPIEEGSFNVYNKTTEPLVINALLAFDENKGSYHTIDWSGLKTSITRKTKNPTISEIIARLVALKKLPLTFNIITPYCEYKNMTLETYEYAWKREQGLGVLFVNVKFKEVPQIKVVALTPEKVKSASCVTPQKRGTVTPSTPTSLAYDASEKGGLVDSFKAFIKKIWN